MDSETPLVQRNEYIIIPKRTRSVTVSVRLATLGVSVVSRVADSDARIIRACHKGGEGSRRSQSQSKEVHVQSVT